MTRREWDDLEFWALNWACRILVWGMLILLPFAIIAEWGK